MADTAPRGRARVAVRIQHHPARADLLPRLLPGLDGLPVEVVPHSSEPPNPWEGYKLCLTSPPDCTHLLIVQDDVLVCRNFAAAVHAIADAQPDVPVCLFLGNLPMRTRGVALQAAKAGVPYCELVQSDFVPVVATMWPVAKAQRFLGWAATQPPRRVADRADDGVAGRWMRHTSARILATLPSLVEHPDDVASFVRQRPHKRNALVFIGDRDPLEIDWHAEHRIPPRPPRTLRSQRRVRPLL